MEEEVALLLNHLYPHFNARHVDRHDAIRTYWRNQWATINSQVTPISYRVADGRVILEVHQLVKDMEGATLSDSVVFHTYTFANAKVARMDISDAVPAFGESTPATSTEGQV